MNILLAPIFESSPQSQERHHGKSQSELRELLGQSQLLSKGWLALVARNIQGSLDQTILIETILPDERVKWQQEPDKSQAVDPETLNKLRALGYVN